MAMAKSLFGTYLTIVEFVSYLLVIFYVYFFNTNIYV